MARSIYAAVRQIKAEVARFLSPQLIGKVCRAVGHLWRDRILDVLRKRLLTKRDAA